jgi:ferredoxin-NADP reductase
MVLPNLPPTDAEGNRRVFSIASPPQDTRRLVITTRMTGTAFTRSLAEVSLGTPVDLSGPAGTFGLHADASLPAVFIAGGIGVTPFRSILHDAVSRHLPHCITSGQPWDGERRPVTADFLRSHIAEIPTTMFYLAGPPGLVAGVAKTLSDAGADPARVHCEEFAGY